MLKKKNSSYSLSDKKIRSYPLSNSNSISLNKKVNNSLPTDLSLSIKTPNNNFRTDNYYVDLSQHMKDLKIIKKANEANIIISDLLISFKFFTAKFFIVPKITLFVSQSI